MLVGAIFYQAKAKCHQVSEQNGSSTSIYTYPQQQRPSPISQAVVFGLVPILVFVCELQWGQTIVTGSFPKTGCWMMTTPPCGGGMATPPCGCCCIGGGWYWGGA